MRPDMSSLGRRLVPKPPSAVSPPQGNREAIVIGACRACGKVNTLARDGRVCVVEKWDPDVGAYTMARSERCLRVARKKEARGW